MTAKMSRRGAGVTIVALMLSSALAGAAGPDTRVPDAAAQQDWRAVEALVKTGAEVNAAQMAQMRSAWPVSSASTVA